MSAINNRGLRLLLGCLIAPLTGGIVLLCISAFGNISEGFWALKMSAIVGYPAMLILGLPAYLIFRKLRWTGLLSYFLVGLLIGATVATVIFSPAILGNIDHWSTSPKSLAPSAAIFVLASIYGALSSSVFWLVARPDRI
jgi:hypothetical protein